LLSTFLQERGGGRGGGGGGGGGTTGNTEVVVMVDGNVVPGLGEGVVVVAFPPV